MMFLLIDFSFQTGSISMNKSIFFIDNISAILEGLLVVDITVLDRKYLLISDFWGGGHFFDMTSTKNKTINV